jgi:hypothetical protein
MDRSSVVLKNAELTVVFACESKKNHKVSFDMGLGPKKTR